MPNDILHVQLWSILIHVRFALDVTFAAELRVVGNAAANVTWDLGRASPGFLSR